MGPDFSPSIGSVAASVGRDLEEFSATIGLDAGPLAQTIGIDPKLFADFDARVDFDAFCRLLEVLATISKRETFGIDYANFFHPGGTGALGQGLAAAPTIEVLFRFLTTYMTTIADHRFFEATYEQDAVTIEWSYSPLLTRSDHYVDFSVRSVVKILAAITKGRQRYKLFSFRHEAPKNVEQFRLAFPGPLRFGQDSNQVVFATDLFDMANPQGDPVAFEFMRQACEKNMARRRMNKPLDVSLREDIVEQLPNGGLSIEEASHQYGMSVRTMQRRLSGLEMTYESLVDEARASLILALLKDPTASMAMVAESVGYSDQSALSRAVVKRFDQTPTQLRVHLLKSA